ncbi:MAG: HAD family hydrolase, partial [Rhodococcus sp. (in: high G+C Gram-positive bacteria)]
MTALIATDLDRTMIFSAAALSEGSGSQGPGDITCVEMYDGAPLSFMTVRAVAMLTELAATAVVVPTTTRTTEQFQRIALPGAPWRYAITANGGTILVDGEPDRAWRDAVDAAVRASAAPLSDVVAEMTRRSGSTSGTDPSWVLKQRVADDLFCYLVVDVSAMPTDFTRDFGQWCTDHGWGLSQQGRKIYAMPDAVCKSRAIAEVKRRLVADRTLDPSAQVLA